MRSVALTTRRRTDLVFHLLHLTLSAEQKADFVRLEREFGAQLVWYDLSEVSMFEQIVHGLPTVGSISKMSYARMVIDRLLDPSITRVLYLDSDVLVRVDIGALYGIDMQGYPIAAVRDAWGAFFALGRDQADRSIVDSAVPYFNAGVLLIDVPRWREAGIVDRIAGFVSDGRAERMFMDQDMLNVIFEDKWLQLPFTWNLINARPVHEALLPGIVHYTGKHKPWALFSRGAFRRIYRHTMTNELFYHYMRHRWKRTVRRWLRLG